MLCRVDVPIKSQQVILQGISTSRCAFSLSSALRALQILLDLNLFIPHRGQDLQNSE